MEFEDEKPRIINLLASMGTLLRYCEAHDKFSEDFEVWGKGVLREFVEASAAYYKIPAIEHTIENKREISERMSLAAGILMGLDGLARLRKEELALDLAGRLDSFQGIEDEPNP